MWSTLFVISISQGTFFLLLLWLGRRLASAPGRYLSLLLILFLVTNIDYFLVASGLYRIFPALFGISNGLMLLMGPVLYKYANSLLGKSKWSWKDLVHLIPYLVFLSLSIQVLLLPPASKIAFIDTFIAGKLPLRKIDYVVFVLQVVHIGAYLLFTFRAISGKNSPEATAHAGWLRLLTYFLCGYGVLVAVLVSYIFTTQQYSLTANYSYTLACSFLLYFIVGFALLAPSSALERLKKGRKPLRAADPSGYLQKLTILMEEEKVFTRPEIRLQDVATLVGLTPHQLSQLINEHSGRNFSDLINYYRVEEFKKRLSDPVNDHLTLVGLALEIGFSSKTSFNNTFKKFTGITPSEYKRSAERAGTSPGR